jgi:hypothetical protein
MRRSRRLVAGFTLAAVLLAACLPGVVWLHGALAEPMWVLLVAEVLIPAFEPAAACNERPAPLRSFDSPRGPPTDPLA